jgi:hypothetical protein
MNDKMKKWANEMNRAFSKNEVQMAKKHMKKYTSPAIKKMQIKTTLRFHLHTCYNGYHEEPKGQQMLGVTWR